MAADLHITLNGTPTPVYLGENTTLALMKAQQAAAFADAAEESAAFAEEFSGPAYATVGAGEAATTEGQFFRVPIPATDPVEYTRYQRTSGGSVEAAPLATTGALASDDPGKGASMVGFREDGSGAVSERVDAVLRKIPLHPEQYGAVGDGVADDTGACEDWVAALVSTGRPGEARGAYMVDQLVGASGITITGTGTFKKRIDEDAPTIDLTDCDNVTLQGITIDGNKAIQTGSAARQNRVGTIQINSFDDGNTSTGIRLIDVTVVNAHGPGIKGFAWTDFLARNVTVHDCEGRGWQFGSECHNVRIENATVYNCYQTGISHNGQGTMSSPLGTSDGVFIVNPYIHDIVNDPLIAFSGIGIEMIGETSGAVIGGEVFDCASIGVSTGFITVGRVEVLGTHIHDISYVAGTAQGWGIEATAVDNGYYTPIIENCRIGYYVGSGKGNYLGGKVINPVVTSHPGDESYTRAIQFTAFASTHPDIFSYGGPCDGHRFCADVQGGHYGVFLSNPSTHGDAIKNIEIAATFRSCYRGFWALPTGANFTDIGIIGSQFFDCWDVAARTTAITRPRFSDNYVKGERNSGCKGLVLQTAVDPIITNNRFYSITGVAIDHTSASGTLTQGGNTAGSGVGSLMEASTGYSKYNVTNGTASLSSPHRVITAATYAVLEDDCVILMNTASAAGAQTVTLPATPRRCRDIIVKDQTGSASTKNTTIDGNGKNINGSSTLVISTNYGVARLHYDGTRWLTL